MRVDVYWNLHKHCYSVKCSEPRHPAYGRVLFHARAVVLDHPQLLVSLAGNTKVRETGRKNVHAVMRGWLLAYIETGVSEDMPDAYNWRTVEGLSPDGPPDRHCSDNITYNPYLDVTFVRRVTFADRQERTPVRGAKKVVGYSTPASEGCVRPALYAQGCNA